MAADPGRILKIFTEAIQFPTGERAAFLNQACGADEALRRNIEALLKSNDRAGAFLEEPLTAAIEEGRAKVFAVGEKPGDSVGRYKLLQRLGEGGYGIVFLAEQVEPVRRRVALKVIKPGMDTKSVIARFEAERQALALMDHPNIARVFDAGATESGRPYFVMELVEGVKITEYCDRHSLPTNARLELFTQVCEAIQHAHQKGIIHRDIKPSNVLVANGMDGKPSLKVIDFGIAKATAGQRLTDETALTAAEMLIGTPAYMSPEQATLTSVDVDTRTDIYSLGVLLYELLTGTTPFDTRELLKAGLDEVRRVIRDEDPVRPSARLSTMMAADLVNVSRHHGAEAPKLIREIRGDLDWIVIKALEKDRARRYATAHGLAQDVGRYLSDEAILARPPSAWYQLRKLADRNRLLFGSISVVAAVLVIGFVAVTIALSRTQEARREAETDKTKSEQVTRFLKKVLMSAGASVALGRDSKMMKEILDQSARRLTVELANQPAVQADLRMLMGQVYGDIGQYQQAEAMFRQALAIRASLFGKESEAVAEDLFELSNVLDLDSKEDEAETTVRRALVVRQKIFGEKSVKVAECYTQLGAIYWSRQQLPEAEKVLRKSQDILRQLLGDDSPELGDSLVGLGSVMYAQGNYGEAERLYQQAMKNWKDTFDENHPSMVLCVNCLAVVLAAEGKDAEAVPVLRRTVAIRRKLYGEDHATVATSLDSLTRALNRLKEFDQAEVSGREAFAIGRKLWGDTGKETLEYLRDLLNALLQQRKFDEAERLFAELLPPDRDLKPEQGSLLYERCDARARSSRWREAAADAETLLKWSPSDHENYHMLAPLLVQLGDIAQYQKLCQTMLDKFSQTTNVNIADRMAKDCLIVPSSVVDLRAVAAMADVALSGDPSDPAMPHFQFCKGLAEFRMGRYEKAINWAQQASEGPLEYPKACALAVVAMSKFKLNQGDEAKASLFECNAIIGGLPKPGEDLGRDWRDWIIAHTLQQEAENLINHGGQ